MAGLTDLEERCFAINEYLALFKAFFFIGAFTFGGGYAMLPMLEREVVQHHNWATQEELLDYFAIGQCTPGIIAVNVATIVGYRRKGLLGAAFSTSGVIAPSLAIILTLAGILRALAGNGLVSHAFGGIRVAVCALILYSVAKLFKSSITDAATLLIFIAALATTAFLSLSPVITVAAASLAGVAIGAARERRSGK